MSAAELCASASRSAPPPPRPGANHQQVTKTGRSCRLLLIDDDESLVYFTRRNLEEVGFVVDVAMDGKRGLSSAMASAHDVILLDHDLPLVTGIEILRALHDAAIVTPVIMITGKGTEQVAFDAGRLGARQYLTKPFWPVDLIQSIRTILDGTIGQPPSGEDSGAVQPLHASNRELRDLQLVPERPLYARWVQSVLAVVAADRDPRIEEDWASCVGASVATLRQWHRVGRLPVGRSQLLARVLRAAVLARRFGGSLEDFLKASDRRTIERMVELAGAKGARPSVKGILARQRLVSNRFAVMELERALETAGLV